MEYTDTAHVLSYTLILSMTAPTKSTRASFVQWTVVLLALVLDRIAEIVGWRVHRLQGLQLDFRIGSSSWVH